MLWIHSRHPKEHTNVFSYTVSQYLITFAFMAVTQEVNKIEKLLLVQKVELTMTWALQTFNYGSFPLNIPTTYQCTQKICHFLLDVYL
jgi:hypothetical protein